MSGWREFVLDAKVRAEEEETLAIELTTIIENDRPCYLKTAQYVLRHEVSDLCFRDHCQCFYLHPFSEVIYRHKQEFHLFLPMG